MCVGGSSAVNIWEEEFVVGSSYTFSQYSHRDQGKALPFLWIGGIEVLNMATPIHSRFYLPPHLQVVLANDFTF